MKRLLPALALAACLAQPAQAAGPLAALVLDYIKQSITEAVVSQVRSGVANAVGERMGHVPGMGLLGALVPELGLGAGMGTGALALPKEAQDALAATGMLDANAKPLTDAEWQAYEGFVRGMAQPGEDMAEDLAQMRGALAQMPQMAGLVRAQLNMFIQMQDEQARMREAYAQMSEPERQQVAAQALQSLQELPPEDREHALLAMQSPTMGLPEDLRQRLQTAAVR